MEHPATKLYDLALMGAPTAVQIGELEASIRQAIAPFGLQLGQEVGWQINPDQFQPSQKTPAAIAFLGGQGALVADLGPALHSGIPVLPVASADGLIVAEIPPQLREFNCLTYAAHGPTRVATALLECVGLLPRQRRVFLS